MIFCTHHSEREMEGGREEGEGGREGEGVEAA